jgi:DNA repair protein RadC
MAITDWPLAERPRERLLEQGAHALSDAELVAVFLRTGIPGLSAVDLARNVLVRFDGLRGLLYASQADLCAVKGLGSAKYAQLQAVLEMARRTLAESARRCDIVSSPAAARDYLRLTLTGKPHEVFMALLLDAQNRLLAAEELFRGTLTQTSVYPREVLKRTMHHNAAAVIFAHNHPSGVAEPSRADELLTRALKNALALVDVKVLDHVIVAGNATLSFAEKGLL